MLKPRLLAVALMAIAVTATSCPRYRYVGYRWEFPVAAAFGTAIRDSVLEGRDMLTRSDTALFRDCGTYRAYDLTRLRKDLVRVEARHRGIYLGFAPDSGAAFELLLHYDPRMQELPDSLAARIGRLALSGAGVPIPQAPPSGEEIDVTELSKKWCVEP